MWHLKQVQGQEISEPYHDDSDIIKEGQHYFQAEARVIGLTL